MDRRIPSLDVLRALAVLLVVWFHTVPQVDLSWEIKSYAPWATGLAGVRLFFVLSGFLITGILLTTRDAPNRWYAWRAFYLRRALRILPLAYAAIVIVNLADPELRVWPYVLYINNWLQNNGGVYSLGHFWSLAIEEQFYLVWPAFILWAPRSWMLPIIGVLILSAGGLRLLWPVDVATIHTFARMDALAWGAALALVPVSIRSQASLGLIALSVAVAVPSSFNALAEWSGILFSGALVMAAVRHPTFAAWRPLLWLGTISYGVYVLHFLVPYAFGVLRLPFPEQGLGQFLLVSAVSSVAASISWVAMERPLNALKQYVPYQRQPPVIEVAALGSTTP